MKYKHKQIQYACYMPPGMVEELQKLSKETKVPVSEYIRRSIALFLSRGKKNGKSWREYW